VFATGVVAILISDDFSAQMRKIGRIQRLADAGVIGKPVRSARCTKSGQSRYTELSPAGLELKSCAREARTDNTEFISSTSLLTKQ
jgi:hypothetical protein